MSKPSSPALQLKFCMFRCYQELTAAAIGSFQHDSAAASLAHLFLLFDCICTPQPVHLQDATDEISEIYGLRQHSQHR